MEEKQYKLVFNPGVARHLLRAGVPISDIKKDRTDPNKTVFVFKRTPEFEEAFTKINEEISAAKVETEQ